MWPAVKKELPINITFDMAEEWLAFLDLSPFLKHKLCSLFNKVEQLRKKCIIYPPQPQIMSWSYMCKPEDIKVVILGQDPYHGGQANGQAFSVNRGFAVPPSLKNIFREIHNCYSEFISPGHGCLEQWGERGVLLLNTVLTVEEKKPGSHFDLGWIWFTNYIIATLSEKLSHCVFMLWGSKAIAKGSLINSHKHLVLKAQHPSPLAAKNNFSSSWPKFLGCGHFSTANKYLLEHGREPVDWTLNP